MKIIVIKEDAVITSEWAGGITKQYYIFPQSASLDAKDFSVRLSMATAFTDEEAKFTPLNNITRHLIILEGSSHIIHNGRYDIIMHPYAEIDVFDGGWETFGRGKITDFNMLLGKNAHGKMSVVGKNGTLVIGGYCETCHNSYKQTAFFCGIGHANFRFSTGESLRLSKGDLLLLENISRDLYTTIELLDSKLVRMDWCCC